MQHNLQLKSLRKRAGFNTQADLAQTLGVNPRTYASWERGEVKLTLGDAQRIADVLGCSLDELAGRAEPADRCPSAAARIRGATRPRRAAEERARSPGFGRCRQGSDGNRQAVQPARRAEEGFSAGGRARAGRGVQTGSRGRGHVFLTMARSSTLTRSSSSYCSRSSLFAETSTTAKALAPDASPSLRLDP